MFLKSFLNSIVYINEIQLDECERGNYFLTLKKLFVKSKLRQCNHRKDLLVLANQKNQLFKKSKMLYFEKQVKNMNDNEVGRILTTRLTSFIWLDA